MTLATRIIALHMLETAGVRLVIILIGAAGFAAENGSARREVMRVDKTQQLRNLVIVHIGADDGCIDAEGGSWPW